MAEKETVFTDESVVLTLSRDTVVNKVLIGGKEVKFSQNGRMLTITKEDFANASLGKNIVTIYSANGRAETPIELLVRDMTAVNNSKTVSIICLCIVSAVTAAGVGGYFLISKNRGRKI